MNKTMIPIAREEIEAQRVIYERLCRDKIQALRTRTMLQQISQMLFAVIYQETVVSGISFSLAILFCNHYTTPMLIPMTRTSKDQKIICNQHLLYFHIFPSNHYSQENPISLPLRYEFFTFLKYKYKCTL